MQFIKVGNVTDFEIITIKSYSMLGRKVGVIKRPDGSFLVGFKPEVWASALQN